MQRIPRWAWVLGGIGVVVVLLALALPMFLDVDRYRPTIVAAMKEQTGRDATIGRISARLLPTPGFSMQDVALGNPPGFPDGRVLSIESISGGVEFSAFLRNREIRLTSLVFDKPKLTLLEDSRGKTNYDFAPAKKKGSAPPASDAASFQLAAIPSIEFQDVELVMGRVTPRGVTPILRVTGISATLGNVALDSKAIKQWTADAALSGVQLQLSAFKDPLEFRSGSFKLRDGSVTSEFEAELAKVGRAKGTLQVADITNAKPRFTLSTGLLDLDALSAATKPAAASAAAPASGPSELLAQGKITADRLRYAPFEATGASADVKVFSDRIEMSPVTMSLYGGSASGSLRIDQRRVPEYLSLNVAIKNLDVGKLAESLPGTKGAVTGTGALNLQAGGPLSDALLDNLSGTGDLAIRDGSLPQFNLGALQTLAKLDQLLSGGKSGSGGTTFSYFGGDLNIAGGRVASNRVHMDSNLGTMDLRGSFGFDKTLSYDGQAVLAGGSGSPASVLTGILGSVTKTQVQSVSIPFAVSGTFDAPKVRPGRGIPGLKTASPSQSTTQPADTKKKSILDLFRKP